MDDEDVGHAKLGSRVTLDDTGNPIATAVKLCDKELGTGVVKAGRDETDACTEIVIVNLP